MLLVVKKYGELKASTTQSSAKATKMLAVWRYLRRRCGALVRMRAAAGPVGAISSIFSPRVDDWVRGRGTSRVLARLELLAPA